MTVRELIKKLMDMPIDADVAITVPGRNILRIMSVVSHTSCTVWLKSEEWDG
jgi:hypothetical protein